MSQSGEVEVRARPVEPDARRGRILIIDDEEQLTKALGAALSPDYDYVLCSRARSALDLFARGLRFDVILCDLIMPEMNGMELYGELSRRAPDLASRMVFMTGCVMDQRVRRFLAAVPNVCLEKPFETRRLRALIEARLAHMTCETSPPRTGT